MSTSRNTMSFDAGRACELLVVDEDHVDVKQGDCRLGSICGSDVRCNATEVESGATDRPAFEVVDPRGLVIQVHPFEV